MDSVNEDVEVQVGESSPLTEWKNEPSVSDLKQDFNDAKPARDEHVSEVGNWLDHLHISGTAKIVAKKNRSSVQPKTIRKNNEWRYPSLSEPFLSTPNVFDVKPYTWEDKEAARQNGLVLNHQFNHSIQKVAFFDELARTAVDEGTAFVRVGWEFEEREEEVTTPIFNLVPAQTEEQMEQLNQASQGIYPGNSVAPHQEWKDALKFSQEQGRPIVPIVVDEVTSAKMVTTKNQPTVEIVPFENFTPDPSCNGDLSKAKFAVYSFETSKADLQASGLYSNLDEIMIESHSVLAEPDFEHNDDSSFNFKDEPRKKFVAYEYWGFWDIEGDGVLKPIVATWVGDVLIRMEENPFPDKQIPFVSTQYLPKRKSLYGEPDGELLIDNQKIIGAVTRGMIDIMARSANGQTGMRKDMLDVVNKRKWQNGEDYEYNQTVDPRIGVHMHTFSEIPNSAPLMVQGQQNEANEMTGVRPYGATAADISGSATATQARGLLDAASKRETAILRRISECVRQIGAKFISMSQEFLEDEEIFRITNDEFLAIRREELAGKFDLVLTISTAEEDNAKASELAFMLQTVGPSAEPEIVYGIMADIADLRRMPALAERLRDYTPPPPSPLEQAMAEAEVQKAQLENSKLEAEIAKIYADAGLNQQKTSTEVVKQGNIQSDTDLKNLEYIEEELGVNHERELEIGSAQAKSNLQRDLINKVVDNGTNQST